jgi:hypothetical protein
MVTFFPVWSTPVGDLANVAESVTYSTTANATANGSTLFANSITLAAVRTATFMGEGTDHVFLTDNSAPTVSNAYINTHSVEFSANGNSISFYEIDNFIAVPIVANATDIVTLISNATITYTLLHDFLPPGMSLSNSGEISGKVGILPTANTSMDFPFAVRAFDGTYARDRQFTIHATASNSTVSPPSWGPSPPFSYSADFRGETFALDDGSGFIATGSHTRGSPYTYQININMPGGFPPQLTLEPLVGETEIVEPFNSLPPGLTLDDFGLITGEISTATPMGLYFFRVIMRDHHGAPITVGSGAIPRIFMIEAAPPKDALAPLRFIKWTTDAGLIGTVYEANVFPLGVRATCSTGEAVTYSLYGNGILPPGLTLNSVTGDIEGVLGHVSSDHTYTFVVRAKVGDTTLDRTFSIKVLVRYRTGETTNVSFKLRFKDTKPMMAYYSDVVHEDEYFRPNDGNFGVVGSDNTLNIYVVGGLKGDYTAIRDVVRASNVGGPISLRLGEHKLATVKIGGKVVYEVLYRDVIDPMTRAGGYKLSNAGVPVPDPLVWPESTAPIKYLHPTSVLNIRYEFIDKVGFASVDGTRDHTATGTTENTPDWMPTFQTATVVAYLKPGAGETVMNRISVRQTPAAYPMATPDPMNRGFQVDFDQYYVTFMAISAQTIFDDNTTTFDDGATTFDIFTFIDGKYYRINTKTAGNLT